MPHLNTFQFRQFHRQRWTQRLRLRCGYADGNDEDDDDDDDVDDFIKQLVLGARAKAFSIIWLMSANDGQIEWGYICAQIIWTDHALALKHTVYPAGLCRWRINWEWLLTLNIASKFSNDSHVITIDKYRKTVIGSSAIKQRQ